MANGIAIKDVTNKLQGLNGEEVIPISTGADEPEVVEVDTLKEYINEDVDTALEGKQDIINDLATIRSGAALGATAVQVESDPTVPAWAKESQKPSYSYSEITGKPTLSAVATSGSYNDLSNKPNIPTVPSNVSAFTNDAGYLTEHQDISGKANSNDLATVAFSGDYEDLTNTPTIPDVPEWAMSSTKPSYTISEIDGAQEELVSGTNIKTINNESILGSGNITIQGGGGSQVQSDWNQSDNTAVDYIKNKPTIPVIPSNLAYTSNDNGEGIIPSDGIRTVTVTSAATMTINPDVVTVIDGAVGTAAITLQVPQDNLAHVWDILLTTDSTVAITFAMSNSATILTPSGFSIGASKAVEISVIGVGTKYYLRYGEFA